MEVTAVRQSFLGEILHLVPREVQHLDAWRKVGRCASETQVTANHIHLDLQTKTNTSLIMSADYDTTQTKRFNWTWFMSQCIHGMFLAALQSSEVICFNNKNLNKDSVFRNKFKNLSATSWWMTPLPSTLILTFLFKSESFNDKNDTSGFSHQTSFPPPFNFNRSNALSY